MDWLTCTSNYRGVGNPLERWAYGQLEKESAAERPVSAARRLGFEGHRTDSIFIGRRDHEVMVQISGPSCTPLAPEAISLSTNVSRIDWQVTVWTEGEQAHLGSWTYKKMVSERQGTGRPGSLKLIVGHPDGETLSVNQRISDAYGRLYDKSSESKLGAPRLVWRYEVEWKGRRAQWMAGRLLASPRSPTAIATGVRSWWSERGVEPAFSPYVSQTAFDPFISSPSRDRLTWFRDSVSVTVARCIKEHGAAATIDALGLSNYLEGGRSNANN